MGERLALYSGTVPMELPDLAAHSQVGTCKYVATLEAGLVVDRGDLRPGARALRARNILNVRGTRDDLSRAL